MCWKQGLGKNTKQELSVINQPVPKSYIADVNSGPSQLRGQDGPFVTEEGSWRICISVKSQLVHNFSSNLGLVETEDRFLFQA